MEGFHNSLAFKENCFLLRGTATFKKYPFAKWKSGHFCMEGRYTILWHSRELLSERNGKELRAIRNIIGEYHGTTSSSW
jgi:hypothetical protein